MKRRMIAVAAIPAFLVLSVCSAAFARSQEDDATKNDIINELNLTQQQQDLVQKQRQQQRERARRAQEEMQRYRSDLRKEIETDTPDRQKIANITAGMKRISGERIDERVEGILSMKEALTPEQFKKLNERMNTDRHSKRGVRQ
jgi:Spy/CpxP family protein refolding chaperone